MTTAPAYTLDQISKAGASLVDAGKMEQLLALLAKYGVQAVTQLQPEPVRCLCHRTADAGRTALRRCPMPPEKHALLSASSASRWLKCTAAPRFEEHLPERTSEYAEEGRLAHSICELKDPQEIHCDDLPHLHHPPQQAQENPLYSEEMDKTSDLYIEHLIEQAMLYDSTPTVVAEVQVDFGEYVPEGFGTCDNVMIAGDTLSITGLQARQGCPGVRRGQPADAALRSGRSQALCPRLRGHHQASPHDH